MIFISHTHADKPIVEPIAVKFAEVFGTDKVFYDSWSIQPGDGIIDKMEQGLSQCEFFFFFVSKNSLQSKMVSLEWQNTILRATQNKVKLIPVKLDDCLMPVILLQTLYIDVFGKGIDTSMRQMFDVINGSKIYTSDIQTFENIRGYITINHSYEYTIEFRAECYLEPISKYCVMIENDLDNVTSKCLTDGARMRGSQANATLNNGKICNILFESVSRGTTPSFPYRIKISTKNKEDIKLVSLGHACDEANYSFIPTVIR